MSDYDDPEVHRRVLEQFYSSAQNRDRYERFLISQIRFLPARLDAQRAYRRRRAWWRRMLRKVGR